MNEHRSMNIWISKNEWMNKMNEWMHAYFNTMKDKDKHMKEHASKQYICTKYIFVGCSVKLVPTAFVITAEPEWSWNNYILHCSLCTLSLSCSDQLFFNPMGHIFTEQPVMVFNIRLFAPPPSALYEFSDPLALVFRAPAAKHIFSSLALDPTWGFIPLPWS